MERLGNRSMAGDLGEILDSSICILYLRWIDSQQRDLAQVAQTQLHQGSLKSLELKHKTFSKFASLSINVHSLFMLSHLIILLYNEQRRRVSRFYTHQISLQRNVIRQCQNKFIDAWRNIVVMR